MRTIGVVAGLLLWAAPSSAFAFELLTTQAGEELRWLHADLPYDAVFRIEDPEGAAFARALRIAFDRWALASRGRVRPRWLGPAEAAAAEDGRSTALFSDPFDPAFGDPARTVAHTELYYDTDSGEIREADFYLNGAGFAFGDGTRGTFDTETVLLHEIGHSLGLAHTCGEPGRTYPSCFSVPDVPAGNQRVVLEAVMAPTLSVQLQRRGLTDDDRAGLLVHQTASATVTIPILEAVDPCGAVQARDFDPSHRAQARYASGLQLPLNFNDAGALALDELTVDPAEGDLDLLLVDPASGGYSALVAWKPQEACPGPPVPPPEPPVEAGCDCRTGGSGGRQGAGVLVTLLIVGLLLRSRGRPQALLLLVALSGLAPTEAWAYKCSRVGGDVGPSLVWPTRSIPWVADPNVFLELRKNGVADTEVTGSFDTWTEVDCSDLALPYQGEVPGVRAELNDPGPNVNALVWVASNWAYDPLAIAVTTSAYDRISGVVVDADIELNAQHFVFGQVGTNSCLPPDGYMDLRNTLTHEVGHVVGLDHPPFTPRNADSTMYAEAPPCETKKRSLAQDDRDGICTIYPSGQPTVQCFPPDGPSFLKTDSDDGFGCTTTRQGSGLWLSILALALVLRRRA